MAFNRKAGSHALGHSERGHGSELMITPLLDLFVALIPFLIISAAISRMNVVDVGISQPGAASTVRPDPKDVSILLRVFPARVEISVNGKVEAQVARTEKIVDWTNAAHAKLVEIKKLHMDELKIQVEPEERASLETVMTFMDAVRDLRPEDGDIVKKDENGHAVKLRYLFPKVILKGVYS